MSLIPGTFFIVGEDGALRVAPEARFSTEIDRERSSSLKRRRAPSTISSATLENSSSPADVDSDSDFEIIDRPSPRPARTRIPSQPAALNKRHRSSHIEIIEPLVLAPDVFITPNRIPTSNNWHGFHPVTADSGMHEQDRLPQSRHSPFHNHCERQERLRDLPEGPKPSPPVVNLIDDFEELRYGPGGLINVEDFEERFEREFFGPALQARNARNRRPVLAPRPARNPPIALPLIEIQSYKLRDMSIRPGKTVEFANGTFLKIAKVVQNLHTDEVTLRGWLLKRCKDLNGLLPKKLNEVCFILEVELDDHRDLWEQSMIEKGLGDLSKIRHLVCTNYPTPQLGFSRTNLPFGSKEENIDYVRKYERLVVRWKFTTFYDNSWEHSRKLIYPINIRKRYLERLNESECTPGCFMDPAILRKLWRGETIIGGSGPKVNESHSRRSFDQPPPRANRAQQQSTTSEKPFECHRCGRGFDEAEALFNHFQDIHERAHRAQSQSRSSRRYSIIEILDEEEEDDLLPTRRAAISREELEDVRIRLQSILSVDGETMDDGDKVRIVGTDERQIKINLNGTEPVNSRKPEPRLVATRAERGGKQTYTYGDAFCGAGGTTSGAVAAGLALLWGLDLDHNAGQTWRANFPSAQHYEMWAHEVMALADAISRFVVDVLHLSPPCQVFSPVHTVVGRNDQQNFDSLLACDAIVHKARPRMITLEQTFGILHPKFETAFNALIQIFTSYGYSVSYQIVQFTDYGLAQKRRRLIIVAACPGETLPELPPPTHSENPFDRLKPMTTVRQVLNRIPRDAPNHDIQAAYGRGGLRPKWDASGSIPTITCDGGTRGHPDGERGFTDRELASLQSFGHHHVFLAARIKKQIGNAVPPMFAKIMFKAIIQHLEKVDKAESERRV